MAGLSCAAEKTRRVSAVGLSCAGKNPVAFSVSFAVRNNAGSCFPGCVVVICYGLMRIKIIDL